MNSRRFVIAPLLLTLFLAQGSALAGKQMYRWVDAQGKVHYGDTIPPEYANQGNAELSKSGRVVKQTPPAPTPEQLRARQEAEAREREAREKAEEQRRRDRALLASYTTLDELDLAERRNLEAVDVQIKSHELRIKSVQGRLDGLRRQEASSNRPSWCASTACAAPTSTSAPMSRWSWISGRANSSMTRACI